jgi:hypothetical protein
VQIALVGRYYERIADHGVNIGHRVAYMVTGLLPTAEAGPPSPANGPVDDEIVAGLTVCRFSAHGPTADG